MNNTVKADYKNIEKEVFRIVEKRGKAKDKLEKELSEQRATLQKARDQKTKALEGTQEEYLKACENVTREENLLEYLEEKRKKLKRDYMINKEELLGIKREIKKEQDLISVNCLKTIKEEVSNLFNLCQETLKEQKRGSSLYEDLLNVYEEDCSPEEIRSIPSSSLKSEPYNCRYGLNYIVDVLREVEELSKVFNNPGIKGFIGK